jgi:pimeloyl-ACP methyl ester carboxylesterase
MILACPSAGMTYYHAWEPFLFDEFLPHLRETYKTDQTVIFGMSMGGYGALKFAFARPDQFAPGSRDATDSRASVRRVKGYRSQSHPSRCRRSTGIDRRCPRRSNGRSE